MELSSNTTLTIYVDDVNDNTPVILSCSSDAVPETDIIGSPVLTVSFLCQQVKVEANVLINLNISNLFKSTPSILPIMLTGFTCSLQNYAKLNMHYNPTNNV